MHVRTQFLHCSNGGSYTGWQEPCTIEQCANLRHWSPAANMAVHTSAGCGPHWISRPWQFSTPHTVSVTGRVAVGAGVTAGGESGDGTVQPAAQTRITASAHTTVPYKDSFIFCSTHLLGSSGKINSSFFRCPNPEEHNYGRASIAIFFAPAGKDKGKLRRRASFF
jgi:hypothetical protein